MNDVTEHFRKAGKQEKIGTFREKINKNSMKLTRVSWLGVAVWMRQNIV